MKKVLFVLETILFVFLAFITVKSVWSFIDAKTGYNCAFLGMRECVVVSDSMAFVDPSNKERLEGYTDQFKKGDVICTNSSYTYESLKAGDIITYKKPDSSLIVHRIVSKMNKEGVDGLITQGDANNVNDGFIDFKYVNGKVYKIIPNAGVFIGFMQSGYGMLGMFGIIFFVSLGYIIYDYSTYGKYRKIKTGYNKDYLFDKTEILLPKEYESSPKDYSISGGDNHYEFSLNKKEVRLTRYIRVEAKNKKDNSITKATYSKLELSQSIINILIPIAEARIYQGKNGFRYAKKLLKKKGIKLSEQECFDINEAYFKVIKDSGLLTSKEKVTTAPNIGKSYQITKEYLSKAGIASLEKLNYFYNYLNRKYVSNGEKK